MQPKKEKNKSLLFYLIPFLVGVALFFVIGFFVREEIYFKPHKIKQFKQITLFKNYQYQLNDRLADYWKESMQKGIKPKNRKKDIWKSIHAGRLVLIENNGFYALDTMFYSYPYLTPKTKALLDTIGRRFQEKFEHTHLACTRLKVTSLLRSTRSLKRLLKHNRNAAKRSAHLNGTAFDLSYAQFYGNSNEFNCHEMTQLSDTLAKVIYDLKVEQKCYATFEVWQKCYHVVSR